MYQSGDEKYATERTSWFGTHKKSQAHKHILPGKKKKWLYEPLFFLEDADNMDTMRNRYKNRYTL